MVELYLLDGGGIPPQPPEPAQFIQSRNMLFVTARAAVVPYTDPLVALASRLLFMAYHIFLPFSERTTLVVPMAEGPVVSQKRPAAVGAGPAGQRRPGAADVLGRSHHRRASARAAMVHVQLARHGLCSLYDALLGCRRALHGCRLPRLWRPGEGRRGEESTGHKAGGRREQRAIGHREAAAEDKGRRGGEPGPCAGRCRQPQAPTAHNSRPAAHRGSRP